MGRATPAKKFLPPRPPELHDSNLIPSTNTCCACCACCACTPATMSVTKTPKAKKQKGLPTSVADFVVLPLSLPTHPSLPSSCADAKHYLYIKPHAPSQPTESSTRSLFLANLPIDATESNLRALFADQLGGARVETVQFHASIPAVVEHKRFKNEELKVTKSNDPLANRGTKRKREDAASGKAAGKEMVAEGVVEDQDSALPRIWNREIHPSGSGAVVVFLDKASMKGAMSQVQKVVNEGKAIQWVGGEALGAERMIFPHLLVVRAGY